MSYYNKYLKYKNKYEELKKQNGGSKCDKIFDLDCFLPPFRKEGEYDYIFDKKLTAESIEYIAENIQYKYHYFYNYLSFDKSIKYNYNNLLNDSILNFIEYDINKIKLLLNINDIFVPILEINIEGNNIGKVDYETLANKLYYGINLKKDDIIKIYEYIKEYNNIIGTINEDNIIILLNNIDYLFNIKDEPTYFENKIKIISFINNYKDYLITNLISEYYLETLNSIINYYFDLSNQIYNNINKKNKIFFNIILDKAINKLFGKFSNLYNIINEIKNIYTDINEKYYLFNYIDCIDLLSFINYDKKNININNSNLIQIINNKSQKIINSIYTFMNNNNNINTYNLDIELVYYVNNKNNNYTTEKHDNSLLIYKINNNNKKIYTLIRTEPHRHSDTYCRNSIRKFIRNLFLNNKYFENNVYYIDYIINTNDKYGLQDDEEDEAKYIDNISKINNIWSLSYLFEDHSTLFHKPSIKYDIPLTIKDTISPLNKVCGFCGSWTIYIITILLLNKNKSIESIGKYFIDDIDDYSYHVLKKHINLYKIIIYILYYLYSYHKENYESLVYKIKKEDTDIIKSLFKLFDDYKSNDKLFEHVNKYRDYSIDINTIGADIINKDTHLCTDNIFDDDDFCNLNTVYSIKKSKLREDKIKKYKCEQDEIKLVGVITDKDNVKYIQREVDDKGNIKKIEKKI